MCVNSCIGVYHSNYRDTIKFNLRLCICCVKVFWLQYFVETYSTFTQLRPTKWLIVFCVLVKVLNHVFNEWMNEYWFENATKTFKKYI